jgi:hypothetical protein
VAPEVALIGLGLYPTLLSDLPEIRNVKKRILENFMGVLLKCVKNL